MAAPSGLARKSIGTTGLFFFCIGASSPMAGLAGGFVQTYATTGVVGVPVAFFILAIALGFFTVGYVAMTRYVPHAATFYALLARGLGRIWGMAGGTVALVSYNSIQICLYGLLGAIVSGDLGGPWWAWALAAWAVVGLLGVLHININARVLAVFLVCEIALIALFDFAAFTHPAHDLTFEPLSPSSLFVNGVGGAFALSIAAFVGYESGPFYGEEARSHKTVSLASFTALIFLGALLTISSWAMAVGAGVRPVATAQGPVPEIINATQTDPALPFTILGDHYGGLVAGFGNLLLVTSILAAQISLHNSIARYIFGMARERVLPARLGRISEGARGGAPIGGSLVQSLLALVVMMAFLFVGADPVLNLFTWLATIAAIGVTLMMFCTSLAVIGFFRKGGGTGETLWQRLWAPALGAVALAVIFLVTVLNLAKLLGTKPGSILTIIIPGIVVLAAVIGLVWGRVLQQARPDVFRSIGVGEQEPLAVLEHALANLRL
jgi:amino acid transporter